MKARRRLAALTAVFAVATAVVATEASAAPDSAGPKIRFGGPANGSLVTAPVRIGLKATDLSGVRTMRVYLNGKLQRVVRDRGSVTFRPRRSGHHRMRIVAVDKRGNVSRMTRTYRTSKALTGPTVTTNAPPSGTVIRTRTTFGISATDPQGVRLIRIYQDGVVRKLVYAASVSFTIDPAAMKDGAHEIWIVAEDKTGAKTVLTRKYRTQAGGDLTGPSLTLSAPADGATLSGSVTMAATTSDPSGVKEVRFVLDGALARTDSAAPYDWTRDWSALPAGAHSVAVVSEDAAGNTTRVARTYHVAAPPAPSTALPPPPSTNVLPDAAFQSHWQWLAGAGPVSPSAIGPWDGWQAEASDRIVAVTSPRQGISPYSVRFTVKPGDYAGNGNRAEFWDGGGHNGTEYEGTDKYYSFATQFPSGFQAGKWTIFHQMHGGAGMPVVAFQVEYGKMYVMMRGGSESSPTQRKVLIASDVAKDTWHQFVYRVRWYADSRGVLQVWRRVPAQGSAWQQVVDLAGPVGYKGSTWHRPYPKLGLYRDPSITWDTTVYQGGLHMRASSFLTAAALFG